MSPTRSRAYQDVPAETPREIPKPESVVLPGAYTFIGYAFAHPAGAPRSEGGIRLELDVDPAGRWTLLGVATTGGRLVVDLAGEADDPRLPALALVLGAWTAGGGTG